MSRLTRREFVRNLGISSAALPLLMNLPSLGMAASPDLRKQRLVVMFSPNGIIPDAYWPDKVGEDFALKEIMASLKPYQSKTLIMKGVCDRVRGDGDSHMRGMSCLLTGIELFPGNIQGGSDTPAGWSRGLSIDQELKEHFQAQEATRTRFGSLEFGVNVPDRADPWTRMVYAGPNKPVAPIDDPYRMFEKLYGQVKDRESLQSVLDKVRIDLKRVERYVSSEDKQRLEEHATFVRQMEQELKTAGEEKLALQAPVQEPGVQLKNDNMPTISKMQMDLMVNSLANDVARVATLQYTNSVGQARMNWIGVDDTHHELSHKPDNDEDAKQKLIKINTWFCEQLAYLVKKLDETPEPGGDGTLLDNTTVIWTNELGKGNSHTLDDVPLVLVGGGLGFRMGRSLQFERQPHNRLWISVAQAMGHQVETFGNPDFCSGGALPDLT